MISVLVISNSSHAIIHLPNTPRHLGQIVDVVHHLADARIILHCDIQSIILGSGRVLVSLILVGIKTFVHHLVAPVLCEKPSNQHKRGEKLRQSTYHLRLVSGILCEASRKDSSKARKDKVDEGSSTGDWLGYGGHVRN